MCRDPESRKGDHNGPRGTNVHMSSVKSRASSLRTPKDTRGFTLIEILIALSMFLIVLFAIYSSFEGSRATYAAGEQKANIQQNARIAIELMGADLRLTGFGHPATGLAWDSTVSCLPGQEVAIPSAITNATATSLTFWADILNSSTTVLNVDVNPGNTTINVVDASGIQAGDTIYLINGGQSDRLTVQSVPTATTITTAAGPCIAYPWGSQVGRPQAVMYCSCNDPDGIGPQPWACLVNANTMCKDDGEGGGLQPLADNIQPPPAPNTLFTYFDTGGNQIGPPWVVATPADIRRITINLAAQSPQGAWRQQNFNIVSDVRPRNL